MWTELISSNIKALRWQDGHLFVRFLSDQVYEYFEVPEGIFNALLAAPSVGKAFSADVRGKFDFKKC